MNRDLILIKRHYGEKMMHLCRTLFPELLEEKGLLYNTLIENFFPSRSLCDDIVENQMEERFKRYILSKAGFKEDEEKEIIKSYKKPDELLSEAGYILYECHSEEDIQSFKKYYAPGEELCTFRGGRLDKCYVFFAVKKNVDEIERKNFPHPERQDEYGTSVMSIQFNRGGYNWLSIKNRYNHRVNNPDSTFNNNLDNIILGLTDSFKEYYGFIMEKEKRVDFELPNYVKGPNGKYYKYIIEKDGVYFCHGNVVIDWYGVHEYDRSKYLVSENCVLDLENKQILNSIDHAFSRSLGKIESIKVVRDKKTQNKTITINNDIEIILNKDSKIISYSNPTVTEIGQWFLCHNDTIKYLSLPNVNIYGNYVLSNNNSLEYIDMSHVVKIGDDFLEKNNIIDDIYWPQVRYVGSRCLRNNTKVKRIYMPDVISIGSGFLTMNDIARKTLYRRIKFSECYNLAKFVRKMDKHDIKFYYKALA